MSEELSNATRIAALEGQVRQLTEELDAAKYECASLAEAVDHEKRMRAKERERCGVLEREVLARRAFYAAITADEQEATWFKQDGAAAETDTRHALDAAKFVAKSGGGQ